jgi:hypothetical protein
VIVPKIPKRTQQRQSMMTTRRPRPTSERQCLGPPKHNAEGLRSSAYGCHASMSSELTGWAGYLAMAMVHMAPLPPGVLVVAVNPP